MKILFKTDCSLESLDIDSMNYAETDLVNVDGKNIGVFTNSEEGWGCEYIDIQTGQTIDFGDADYADAKNRLCRMIKTLYEKGKGN